MADHLDAQLRAQAEGKLDMSNSSERTAAFLRRIMSVMIAFIAVTSLSISAPALAHKEHKKTPAQTEQVAPAPGAVQNGVVAAGEANAIPAQMGDMDGMDMEMDRSKMTFLERLLGWLGRLHPLAVHFPIAFFPAALLTAVVGRRRPAFSAPVQFLVVAGGIFAPLAAAAGWLAGMSADPEPILTYHRWLGVAIGLSGAGLGIWAWKRPWEDRGAGMIIALTIMTIAIAVQGFLGAAVTHGMDHLMF